MGKEGEGREKERRVEIEAGKVGEMIKETVLRRKKRQTEQQEAEKSRDKETQKQQERITESDMREKTG